METQPPIPAGVSDISGCLIVACTPQTYMARFSPSPGEDKPPLDVDHIFVDEAGYCNCLMSLALMANGVPLTLLGDHKQLPPVCTVDEETLRRYIEKGGFMRYGFLWSQSSLFTESLLTDSPAGLSQTFVDLADPRFARTKRVDLTESHRFGSNLGEILDRCVYRNGVKGLGNDPLEIVCIDVTCPPRDKRVNFPEAEAIRAYLSEMNEPDFCILSPYRTQIETLRKVMPEMENRIMTVHKSQGREWDTVILSVQDGRGCDREVPLRFTSSHTDVGLKVINTAVSRARRKLVIVCDTEFWLKQEDEIIGELIFGSDDAVSLSWDGRNFTKSLNKTKAGYNAGEQNGYKQETEHSQETCPRCREGGAGCQSRRRRHLRCRETQAHGSPRQAEKEVSGSVGTLRA